jgi:hypothetical protein
LGTIGLAKGLSLATSPHAFLRIWTADELPPWIREQVKPWLKLPEETLRPIGAGVVLLSVVMLLLAQGHRGK